MSRFAEVIVIARDAEQIMEPLSRSGSNREWHQCFKPVYDRYFGAPSLSNSMACFMWIIEFKRMNWRGLLSHLESLSWPDPASVQVLIHDEEDDCFGLWMIYDGKLIEVPLPRTLRTPLPSGALPGSSRDRIVSVTAERPGCPARGTPRCSISRHPRRDDHTTCTAVAPDVVLTS